MWHHNGSETSNESTQKRQDLEKEEKHSFGGRFVFLSDNNVRPPTLQKTEKVEECLLSLNNTEAKGKEIHERP